MQLNKLQACTISILILVKCTWSLLKADLFYDAYKPYIVHGYFITAIAVCLVLHLLKLSKLDTVTSMGVTFTRIGEEIHLLQRITIIWCELFCIINASPIGMKNHSCKTKRLKSLMCELCEAGHRIVIISESCLLTIDDLVIPWNKRVNNSARKILNEEKEQKMKNSNRN